MHTQLIEARTESNKSAGTQASIGETIAKIFRSPTESKKYLEWLTREAISNQSKAFKQSVKDIQSIMARKPTQKKAFSLGDDEKPTKRVRLMRGNNTLLQLGLCTQSDIDNSAYMFIVDDVKKAPTKNITDLLADVVKKFAVKDAKALIKVINDHNGDIFK